MGRINKLTPKLRKAPQPPLSHAGAPAEADRAKKPPLVQPSAPDSELNPGDRVEGLADFGKPTGEFGTVEQTNEDDALVKWDDDGRMRLHQSWLKKVGNKAHPLLKPASALPKDTARFLTRKRGDSEPLQLARASSIPHHNSPRG